MTEGESGDYPLQDVDLKKPSVARIYDYLLGGDANWAVDREFARRLEDRYPLIKRLALANRQFLDRAVRYLVDQGIRQFVDIGSGVPTMGNTHEAADSVAPGECHVVYVDHEAVAVAHSQALLHEHGDPRRHAAISADLRDPDHLWCEVEKTGVIDLSEPIGLMIIAVLHVQQNDENGVDIGPRSVTHYRNLLPSGSYLAISHATDDGVPDALAEVMADIKTMYDNNSSPVVWRSREDIASLFDDFVLDEPGLAWAPQWHPEFSTSTPTPDFDTANESVVWVGVGRKP